MVYYFRIVWAKMLHSRDVSAWAKMMQFERDDAAAMLEQTLSTPPTRFKTPHFVKCLFGFVIVNILFVLWYAPTLWVLAFCAFGTFVLSAFAKIYANLERKPPDMVEYMWRKAATRFEASALRGDRTCPLCCDHPNVTDDFFPTGFMCRECGYAICWKCVLAQHSQSRAYKCPCGRVVDFSAVMTPGLLVSLAANVSCLV
jgi:hypothetical protein